MVAHTLDFMYWGPQQRKSNVPNRSPTVRALKSIIQRLSHLHEDIGKQTAGVLRDSLKKLSPATLSTVPCDKTEA